MCYCVVVSVIVVKCCGEAVKVLWCGGKCYREEVK